MTPQELRKEYAGRDVDGDIGWTIHVSTVAQLLKDKDREINKLKAQNKRLSNLFSDTVEVDYMFTDAELARHDAGVIAKFVKELEGMGFVHETGMYGTVWVVDIEDVKHHANQLRQKSQEDL